MNFWLQFSISYSDRLKSQKWNRKIYTLSLICFKLYKKQEMKQECNCKISIASIITHFIICFIVNIFEKWIKFYPRAIKRMKLIKNS